MTLKKKPIENFVGKGENAGKPLRAPSTFRYLSSSANAFNFGKCKKVKHYVEEGVTFLIIKKKKKKKKKKKVGGGTFFQPSFIYCTY